MAGESFMDKLSTRQLDVLGAIACGQDQGHNPRTLRALEARGLIVSHRETLPGQFPVEVTRWELPVSRHIEWARWCAEHADDD